LLKKLPSDHGCQIFLGSKYQKDKNIPNTYKIYKTAIKIYQIAVKSTK
jgi:hypothetical protein